MKTIYEPHPVSPERKAELVKQGYKILDARFAPDEKPEEETAEQPSATKKPRGKRK